MWQYYITKATFIQIFQALGCFKILKEIKLLSLETCKGCDFSSVNIDCNAACASVYDSIRKKLSLSKSQWAIDRIDDPKFGSDICSRVQLSQRSTFFKPELSLENHN